MARRLFYVDEIRAGRAWVRGETAEHLRRVLRAEPGQVYELSDGEAVWLGRIGRCGREEVEFELLAPAAQVRAPVDVHLLAALVKFDRFEWMLEKATELGVAKITPVASLRSERGLEAAARKRRERWQKILREAGQQSRRLRPPVLEEVLELKDALQSEADLRLWLEEEPGARPILDVLGAAAGRLALLCGPEGGWEERERSAAAAAGWAAVSLGPLILRAETAALAAVAVVMAAKDRRG